MIMSGLKFGPDFTGSADPARNIPFRDVYFTSIVRDEKGRKMVEVAGQLARAARPYRDLRRRRRALHHPLPRPARTGHPVRS